MTAIAVVLILIGIIALFFGIFVSAVKFLLWVGIVILIIGIIMWLMRLIRRNA